MNSLRNILLRATAFLLPVVFFSSVTTADAARFIYYAVLNGSNEEPPNGSTAAGASQLTYDDQTHTMHLEIDISVPYNLAIDIVGAHVHAGTAQPGTGTAAPATMDPAPPDFIPPFPLAAGSYAKSFDLTQASTYHPDFIAANGGTVAGAEAALAAALAGGKAYFNVQSRDFPNGEIRGFYAVDAAEIAIEYAGERLVSGGRFIEFGDQDVGTTGTPVTFTIKSVGASPLIITGVSPVGASGNDFTVDTSTIPASLPAGTGETTFTVAFSPTVPGERRVFLTVASNNAQHREFYITLIGRGTPDPMPELSDDAVTATTGPTRLYPLANDRLGESISSVSDPAVQIEGRALIVPAGFTGSFTYDADVDDALRRATVTVLPGTPITGAKNWEGLLYDQAGRAAGLVQIAKSASGRFSASIKVGELAGKATFRLPANVQTAAGPFTAALDSAGRIAVTVGNLTGSLRRGFAKSVAQQRNIALAGLERAVPGGGTARTFTRTNGTMSFLAKLPDGRVVSCAPRILDNGSFVLYDLVAKTLPRATVTGELIAADLAATDVTGELTWLLPAQTSGLHASGLDTILTANGCIFVPGVALPNGPGTLIVAGGDLAAANTSPVSIVAGKPQKTALVPSWTVHASKGTFSARVKDPARLKAVSADGVYLPKSNSAWGHFPGLTVGGRLELVGPTQ
jgi:hypothetical protein